jgi:beta-glucanase (GH16 family)
MGHAGEAFISGRRQMASAGVLMLSIASSLALSLVVATAAQGQWTPYWADEFEGTQLNLTVWEPMTGTGTAYGLPAGWGNNELQYYTNFADNVSVSGGTLKITARQQNFGGRSYTSARIRSLGNVDFKWGRVEARMKIPGTSGVWPAFWMLPTNSPYGGWAASGEIDIMESTNAADRIHGTIHFGDNFPNNASNGGSIQTGIDYAQGFHVYAVEWDPNQIRWYLNGQLYHTVDAAQWYSVAASSNARAPFDHPFHMILNVAVGGNWPGDPDGSAQYPQTMEVDYVRVFRREQAPFGASPIAIPGLIEAEHYDQGYPGEAFQDATIGNTGGSLRSDDVDLQVCSEGGFNVGWIENGEWMEYTVNVASSGTYTLETRVATPSPAGSFHFLVDGVVATGAVAVPNTGGWQNWVTTNTEIELAAGVRTLRFVRNNSASGFNINWFRLTALSAPCSPADLVKPFGELDFFDLSRFLDAFSNQEPVADLAEPIGEFNFFDVSAYLAAFSDGCP